jgi:hypothetical protein
VETAHSNAKLLFTERRCRSWQQVESSVSVQRAHDGPIRRWYSRVVVSYQFEATGSNPQREPPDSRRPKWKVSFAADVRRSERQLALLVRRVRSPWRRKLYRLTNGLGIIRERSGQN